MEHSDTYTVDWKVNRLNPGQKAHQPNTSQKGLSIDLGSKKPVVQSKKIRVKIGNRWFWVKKSQLTKFEAISLSNEFGSKKPFDEFGPISGKSNGFIALIQLKTRIDHKNFQTIDSVEIQSSKRWKNYVCIVMHQSQNDSV